MQEVDPAQRKVPKERKIKDTAKIITTILKQDIPKNYGIKIVDSTTVAIRVPKDSLRLVDHSDIIEITRKLKDCEGIDRAEDVYFLTENDFAIFPAQLLFSAMLYKDTQMIVDGVKKIMKKFTYSKEKFVANVKARPGKRRKVVTVHSRGKYVRYRLPRGKVHDEDIAILPTIRAALMHPVNDKDIIITDEHLREKVRRRRITTLIALVYDMSSSMEKSLKMRMLRDITKSLLFDAYQRRDRIALIIYQGNSAKLILPLTGSVDAVLRGLKNIPYGGTTPLSAGLQKGITTLVKEVKKTAEVLPLMVLITDGIANVPLTIGANIENEIYKLCRYIKDNTFIKTVVIDLAENPSELGKRIAKETNGEYYNPPYVARERVLRIIKS